MRNKSLVNEAETCRQRAKEFAGRPEQPFLLRLADAFDELASIDELQARLEQAFRVG